jgi:hypothetical protein
MQDEYDAVLLRFRQNSWADRIHESLVRNRVAVAQAIQSFQILGRLQLLGQGTAGMLAELVGQLHQPARASSISQHGLTKHDFSKTAFRVPRDHDYLPAKGHSVGSTRFILWLDLTTLRGTVRFVMATTTIANARKPARIYTYNQGTDVQKNTVLQRLHQKSGQT